MTAQTTISRDTLHDFVEVGDVLLNFTNEAIASSVEAVSCGADGTATLTTGTAYPVASRVSAKMLSSLLEAGLRRFVVISNGDNAAVQFAAELNELGLPCVCCVLEELCDAESFMDQNDSDAVAERLRQLGYI